MRGMRAGLELAEPAIREGTPRAEKSSIIAIVATDAPFMPHQMKRLAKRVPLGVALTGGYGYTHAPATSSSPSPPPMPRRRAGASGSLAQAGYIPDVDINPFFDAVVQATEEAILNALTANEDMTGRDGNFVPALPKDMAEGKVRGVVCGSTPQRLRTSRTSPPARGRG